jgi:hypothetical protein
MQSPGFKPQYCQKERKGGREEGRKEERKEGRKEGRKGREEEKESTDLEKIQLTRKVERKHHSK